MAALQALNQTEGLFVCVCVFCVAEAWVEKPSYGKSLEDHLNISGREIAFPIEACVTMLLECGMQEEVECQAHTHTHIHVEIHIHFTSNVGKYTYVASHCCILLCIAKYQPGSWLQPTTLRHA